MARISIEGDGSGQVSQETVEAVMTYPELVAQLEAEWEAMERG